MLRSFIKFSQLILKEEMYGDQSGKFVCGSRLELKGLMAGYTLQMFTVVLIIDLINIDC